MIKPLFPLGKSDKPYKILYNITLIIHTKCNKTKSRPK